MDKINFFNWVKSHLTKGYFVQPQVDALDEMLEVMSPDAAASVLSRLNGWPIPSLRAISPAGVALIKYYEGLRLKAYQDTGGVWTIGYGHTSAAGGMRVYAGLAITHDQAEQLLKDDLARMTYPVIDDLVKVPLSQGQFDALCSFIYNLGATQVSTSTLLKRLNQGNYDAAAEQFGRWIYDNGQKLNGLIARRTAERNLFLT